MPKTAYQRVIVKLSGEALCGPDGAGVAPQAVETIARELLGVCETGVQLGVVVGAGNFVRGRHLAGAKHILPTTADYMGMVATVMNGLALRDTLIGLGQPATVLSAIDMPLVCDAYSRRLAMEKLDAGEVLIFVGGTSHPGVTTDMCAAIRANDIDADAVLKATKVDGVYDCDPARNPSAKRYDRLTYEQAIRDRLGVMDLAAMAFCMERSKPIVVFAMSQAGNLAAAARGEDVGTVVSDAG